MKTNQCSKAIFDHPQVSINTCFTNSFSLTILIGFFLFALSSCAQKPWGENLLEDDEKKYRPIVEAQLSQTEKCSCCINAELKASWETQLSDGAIKGFLQIFQPTSIKFVALNPFGQPLFAYSTDSKQFQSINAAKGVYKYGKIANFVEQHPLPADILDGDWSYWLTGSMNFTLEELVELRQDQTKRGIWLTIEKKKGYKETVKEHLLFDPVRKILLERIIKDSEGHEIVKIIYQKYQNSPTCPLPTSIKLEGISFSATVLVHLSDFLLDQEYDLETFPLKLPPGYIQQQYR